MASEINMTHAPVFEKLGESQVRMQFADRSDDVGLQAREWLKLKELARSDASSARRDAREEETLSIARKALSNSTRANIIATIAMILATAAAISSAVISVIYTSPK